MTGGFLDAFFELCIPKPYLQEWLNGALLHVLVAASAMFLAGRIRRVVFDAYERSLLDKLPSKGRFLILLFMPNEAGDAMLGDLEERFHRIARDSEFGTAHAHFW